MVKLFNSKNKDEDAFNTYKKATDAYSKHLNDLIIKKMMDQQVKDFQARILLDKHALKKLNEKFASDKKAKNFDKLPETAKRIKYYQAELKRRVALLKKCKAGKSTLKSNTIDERLNYLAHTYIEFAQCLPSDKKNGQDEYILIGESSYYYNKKDKQKVANLIHGYHLKNNPLLFDKADKMDNLRKILAAKLKPKHMAVIFENALTPDVVEVLTKRRDSRWSGFWSSLTNAKRKIGDKKSEVTVGVAGAEYVRKISKLLPKEKREELGKRLSQKMR